MTNRFCFHAGESYVEGDAFLVIKIEENEPGYVIRDRMDTLDDAIATAKEINAEMGLSKNDVLDIRASSMTASRNLGSEMGLLRNQVTGAHTIIDRLHEEVNHAVRARDNAMTQYGTAVDELADLKKAVAAKAMELATEHDWCSVVTQALDDLGIDAPDKPVYDFDVILRMRVRATHDNYKPVDEYEVGRAIRDALAGVLQAELLDTDWDDVDIASFDHEIRNLKREN